MPDNKPGPLQKKLELEFKDPDLTDLCFHKTKITKCEKEFKPLFEATFDRIDPFFGLIDQIKDKVLVAWLRKWSTEFDNLYYNFDEGTRVIDKMTDRDFKLLKKRFSQIKYVSFVKLKSQILEIAKELDRLKISFAF